LTIYIFVRQASLYSFKKLYRFFSEGPALENTGDREVPGSTTMDEEETL